MERPITSVAPGRVPSPVVVVGAGVVVFGTGADEHHTTMLNDMFKSPSTLVTETVNVDLVELKMANLVHVGLYACSHTVIART